METSESLRIISIFSILILSILGIISPFFLKNNKRIQPGTTLFITLKCFASGIILSTGFIHMMPEAQDQLKEAFETEYPLSGVISIGAAFLILSIEQFSTQYFAGKASSHQLYQDQAQLQQDKQKGQGQDKAQAQDPEKEKDKENEARNMNNNTNNKYAGQLPHKGKAEADEDNGHCLRHIHNSSSNPQQEDNERRKDNVNNCNNSNNNNNNNNKTKEGNYQEAEKDREKCGNGKEPHHDHDHDHHHQGESHGHAHNLMLDIYSSNAAQAKNFTVAHVLEIGIALHSVIIGITLGDTTEIKQIIALLISLSFHQFFEGYALGTCLVGANITSKLHYAIMVGIFSTTTPIGIVIGFLISSSLDPESATALTTSGVMESVSGGILIYMALVDLISEDYGNHIYNNQKIYMLLTTALGILVMAILALWS